VRVAADGTAPTTLSPRWTIPALFRPRQFSSLRRGLFRGVVGWPQIFPDRDVPEDGHPRRKFAAVQFSNTAKSPRRRLENCPGGKVQGLSNGENSVVGDGTVAATRTRVAADEATESSVTPGSDGGQRILYWKDHVAVASWRRDV